MVHGRVSGWSRPGELLDNNFNSCTAVWADSSQLRARKGSSGQTEGGQLSCRRYVLDTINYTTTSIFRGPIVDGKGKSFCSLHNASNDLFAQHAASRRINKWMDEHSQVSNIRILTILA